MKSSESTQRLLIVIVLSFGIAFFYAAYQAIHNIVAEQSRVQQQALSPVYQLMRDELLRPLYIAETFAHSIDFTAGMDSSEFDEPALLERLAKMERELELSFFVASEKARKQYFSNGRTLNLVEGEVAWYFDAKKVDKEYVADLGQVGDVHLFFDVRMQGADGEFLGYVGVGKRIKRFLDTFDQYKAQYGYDFLFVNDRNEIILSSLPELVVKDAYIPTLDSLAWFRHGDRLSGQHDGEIIEIAGDDLLLSEFGIEELGWRLLLLVPLEARQSQITKAFVTNALAAVLIVMIVMGTLLFLLLRYKRHLEKRSELDQLTGLPNRAYVQRTFAELQRSGVALCAAIIDLDHFKSVNDTHGHEAGDRALQATAAALTRVLREEDIVSRWGGEEFVMLIPNSSIELGRAIAERARKSVEALDVKSDIGSVTITASFGVAFDATGKESLESILSRADKALYDAKEKGRNRVVLWDAA